MDLVVQLTDELWFKTKDYCDNFDSPEAQQLHQDVRELHDEAKANKSPDHLLYKVKALERATHELKNNEGLYSPVHIDDMHDRCIDLEKLLKELSKQS